MANFYGWIKDCRSANAMDTDWDKHDARFHGGHYDPKTMKCSLREDLAKEDGVDDLGNPKADTKNESGPKRWIEFLSLIDKKKGGNPVEPSDIEQMYGELQKITDKGAKKAAAWWLAHGSVKLPEDMSKIDDALSVAKKAKKDPLSYKSPMELILDNKKFRPSSKAIDPDTVPELTDRRDMGHGVVTYQVHDNREGQLAMRRILDTHWGEDANPWCLLARSDTSESRYRTIDEWWEDLSYDDREQYRDEIDAYFRGLSEEELSDLEKQATESYYEAENNAGESGGPEDIRDLAARKWWREHIQNPGELDDAWRYWNNYSALSKRVAFRNGKLLAFMATDVYPDDNSSVDEDELRESHPERAEEYDGEDFSTRIFPPSFVDWMIENYPDETDGVGEQWWDRMDVPHDGIPLGNMAVPDDPFGRWADFELYGSGLQRVGGYNKGGSDIVDGSGSNDRTIWYDNGLVQFRHADDKAWYFSQEGALSAYRDYRLGWKAWFDADGKVTEIERAYPTDPSADRNLVRWNLRNEDQIEYGNKKHTISKMKSGAAFSALGKMRDFMEQLRRIYKESDQRTGHGKIGGVHE